VLFKAYIDPRSLKIIADRVVFCRPQRTYSAFLVSYSYQRSQDRHVLNRNVMQLVIGTRVARPRIKGTFDRLGKFRLRYNIGTCLNLVSQSLVYSNRKTDNFFVSKFCFFLVKLFLLLQNKVSKFKVAQ